MTDDLIRRADSIKAICEDGTCLERQGCYKITMAERKQRDADILSGIPPAQPKHGEWIEDYNNTYGRCRMKCSACGKFSGIGGIKSNQLKPFCPNCGAKMGYKDETNRPDRD